MRPLLFLPSPRDMPEVKEAVNKLNIDKLWIKYFPQEEAYNIARHLFLDDPEYDYTHLIIHPDDMIAQQKDIDNLVKDCTNLPEIVVSGYCNCTAGTTDWEDSNISTVLPPDPPFYGLYDSFHFTKLADLKKIKDIMIEIKFTGFALTAIPRKIVQEIPFRTSDGCCVDSCFSLDLDKKGIKQYLDTRVFTTHIRTKKEILLVGKKEPQIIHEIN
jgi:hypothetical protein